MQRVIFQLYMLRHIYVQADWRSWTYGRAANAISISLGSWTCQSKHRHGANLIRLFRWAAPFSRFLQHAMDTEYTLSTKLSRSPRGNKCIALTFSCHVLQLVLYSRFVKVMPRLTPCLVTMQSETTPASLTKLYNKNIIHTHMNVLYFRVLFWSLLSVFYILQNSIGYCCLYFIFYSTLSIIVVCILYFTVLFRLLLSVFYNSQYSFEHCCLFFIFYSTLSVIACILYFTVRFWSLLFVFIFCSTVFAIVVCILYLTLLFWPLLSVFYILQYCFGRCCLYFFDGEHSCWQNRW